VFVENNKGTPDERKQFTMTLLPLILFSISSNRAQNGNISFDFDLIQMRGTNGATAARGGAQGTGNRRPRPGMGDKQPWVATPGRPRVDVGNEGPERSTTGDAWRPVVCAVSFHVLRKWKRSLHTCVQDVQITRTVTI
jgi:hypothetical protein